MKRAALLLALFAATPLLASGGSKTIPCTDDVMYCDRNEVVILQGDVSFKIPIRYYGQYTDSTTKTAAAIDPAAVAEAKRIVVGMLGHPTTSGTVLERLVAGNTAIGIIGKGQLGTELPPHKFLFGNSHFDATRGLGGTVWVPTSTGGEENLLMLDGDKYFQENILLHEFAHGVMNVGLTESEIADIENLRTKALSENRIKEVYMSSTKDEFWANASQAWFHAVKRVDVTDGNNTRKKISENFPELASLLLAVYGSGNDFHYASTCPKPEKWGSYSKIEHASATADITTTTTTTIPTTTTTTTTTEAVPVTTTTTTTNEAVSDTTTSTTSTTAVDVDTTTTTTSTVVDADTTTTTTTTEAVSTTSTAADVDSTASTNTTAAFSDTTATGNVVSSVEPTVVEGLFDTSRSRMRFDVGKMPMIIFCLSIIVLLQAVS